MWPGLVSSMSEVMTAIGDGFAGLGVEDWFEAVDDRAEELGYFEPLGAKLGAAFIDAGPKLLVTFENYERIGRTNKALVPLGFTFAQTEGWSVLTILSDTDTPYREDRLYRYFDRLVDDGFFEDFEDVLFFGEHLAGYAAAAYSVAAPGCRVLALRPVASADPSVTGWDSRLKPLRRACFTDRYGYAPDMLEGARQAWIAVDPVEQFDAMHVALFRARHVARLPLRRLGAFTAHTLETMGILQPMIAAAMDGSLDDLAMARLYRARRPSVAYLRRLVSRLAAVGPKSRARKAAEAVLALGDDPHVARALDHLRDG